MSTASTSAVFAAHRQTSRESISAGSDERGSRQENSASATIDDEHPQHAMQRLKEMVPNMARSLFAWGNRGKKDVNNAKGGSKTAAGDKKGDKK